MNRSFPGNPLITAGRAYRSSSFRASILPALKSRDKLWTLNY